MENKHHSQNVMSLHSIVKLKIGDQRVSGNILKLLKGKPTLFEQVFDPAEM